MSKIVRIIIIFLITFVVSHNIKGQSGWADPEGDSGQSLIEMWIYGATTPDGALEAGDQIAAFDGNRLVGLLTLTVAPDVSNWSNSQLLAYSFDENGNELYKPGHPIIIKCWDASENKITDAYTWGDGEQIDFHNIWYAPTSDIQQTASNYGAFYPENGSSYCYVNINSTATAVSYNATLVVSVFDDSKPVPQPVNNAVVSAGGYIAVESDPPNGTYTLNLFAGYDIDPPVNYEYLVVVNHDDFEQESFITVVQENNNNGAGYEEDVFFNTTGCIRGEVICYNINSGLYDSVPVGATITTSVFDVNYSTTVDSVGEYHIYDVPDGLWKTTISYPGYTSDESYITIPVFDTIDHNVNLDPLEGEIYGTVFKATTLLPLEDEVIRISIQDTNGVEKDFGLTDADGNYSVSYFAGKYNIVVTDNNPLSAPDYKIYTQEDYTIYPESSEEINFNLVPDPYIPNYDTIFGDEDYVWNIRIEYAKYGNNFLLPYDELVIFDADQDADPNYPDEPGLRVGVLHLTKQGNYQYSGVNVLKAYGMFEDGSQGFIQGNTIKIWGYDVSHNQVYEDPVDWWFNNGVGTYHGNTFPDPEGEHESFLNIYWDAVPGILSGGVNLLSSPDTPVEDVLVEVLNVYTQQVVETDNTDENGEYDILVDKGTYNIRYSKIGMNTHTENQIVILENNLTQIDVLLNAQEEVDLNYHMDKQGFYFIGRAISKENYSMLELVDEVSPGNDIFSQNRHNSWIENDENIQLHYDSDESKWLPEDYNWHLTEAYLMYSEDSYDFNMGGYLVNPGQTKIEFPSAGIYYIPYYPYSGDEANWDEAIVAFEGIMNELDWVMDSEGNRLHHDNGTWIDNIGVMSPLEGYKVKMNNTSTLVYPISAKATKKSNRSFLEPIYYVYNEGNAAEWTYTIHIATTDFEIGDEIAAFSNGVMVGSMVIDSEEPWENDLNMFNEAITAGYEVNTPIELMAYDASEGMDYFVDYEMVSINEGAYIGTTYPAGLDHYSYINLYRGTVNISEIKNNIQLEIFPNPTAGIINIKSSVNIDRVQVYNIYGAIIGEFEGNGKIQPVNLSSCNSGVYVVRVHTKMGVASKQVVVR